MKIIVAGFTKTGTKSINSALTILGFKVHDHLENFWYFEKEWNKILESGGKVEDFQQMYEDVEVVIDSPAYYFWKEIHAAFPNSKIILLTRNDEEWFNSFCNHFKVLKKMKLLNLALCLSPTGRRYFRFIRNLKHFVSNWKGFPLDQEIKANEQTICVSGVILFGHHEMFPAHNLTNKMVLMRNYRQHNADVIMNAPPNKLLIYSVKEGWKPLCKFLNRPIPLQPFPHENIGAAIFGQWASQHPVMKQMIKETWIIISLFASFAVIIISVLFVIL